MRVKVFSVAGATQFAPIAGQGLIDLPENISPRQVVEVPKLGIYCPDGGIGDLLIYWTRVGSNARIPIAMSTETNMTQPDGAASIAVCPGVAPRLTFVSPTGVEIQLTWSLVIESVSTTPKADDCIVSYTIQVSPAPNEVGA